jgi:phosphoserine aminotransferase
MLSFYPGPSKVHPEVLGFIQEAFSNGVVSINHRSERFEVLLKDTLQILHEKWNIPQDYTLYFISSATEAWEIVAQSLIKEKSLHLYNGAFGKKWAHYTKQIIPNALSVEFGLNEDLKSIAPTLTTKDFDTICLVQSETSNGTGQTICRSDFDLQEDAIIAVDATSTMGGINLPWPEADVWFASVQKCMGIPAGLGVLICSSKALERATQLNKKVHYNDVLLMEENRKLFQTHYTPNVLSIYVLNKLAHLLPDLTVIDQQTWEKASILTDYFSNANAFHLSFLIENPNLRLPTVFALQGEPEQIKRLQNLCLKNNIELGKGYGEWKDNTIRIANFPSHTLEDISQLINLINA